jgi:DNA end-binding protein Ku
MARPIWSGAIGFGLVHVPVHLYSATQSQEVSFHQFERGTGQRIRYKRAGEQTDEEVPWERIVKLRFPRERDCVECTPRPRFAR